MYNDDYETCSRTFVTFRLYSDNIIPEKVTELFGLEPSETQSKGEKTGSHEAKINGWFLSSKAEINSQDCRRHIDFVIAKLIPVKDKIKNLLDENAKIDLSCYWMAKNGQGGPTLSKEQFSNLAEIGIDLWFDIY